MGRASTSSGENYTSRPGTPTADFQTEVEEDIKVETSGVLRDLLLALAKVRRADLQGRGGACTWKGRDWNWQLGAQLAGEMRAWLAGLERAKLPLQGFS